MARFLITTKSRFPFRWIAICLFLVYFINAGYGAGLYSKSAGLMLTAIDLSFMMGIVIWKLIKK